MNKALFAKAFIHEIKISCWQTLVQVLIIYYNTKLLHVNNT